MSKKHIFLVSGKRTCGKDTCTEILNRYFESKGNTDVMILGFAKILKECFCKDTGSDFDRMMKDYPYKEAKRTQMTEYFVKMREEKGHDYFSKCLIQCIESSSADIYIISDLRLKCDFDAFKSKSATYDMKFIRVRATDESKILRGWTAKDCDNDFTETDLDRCKEFDKYFDDSKI